MFKQLNDDALMTLTGRKAKQTISLAAAKAIHGKTVLVTGGGGSIGSEICLQTAKLEPKKLIILDINENGVFDVLQEISRCTGKGTRFDIVPVIASVRDRQKMMRVFKKYAPDIVFHAAAHKHVHFMQAAPDEAVKNNVCGTLNIADCCEEYGVSEMLLISSDKAMDPAGYMGASKRLCEMIIQSRAKSKTSFAAVRFGNVMCSAGSVIPLFCDQIASGGPITLTDRRMTRYFMTVHEAVRLVLEAHEMTNGGEIFALDMGEPVKTVDIAEKLIILFGLTPYRDIDIIETGIRPGEKLYETAVTKNAFKTQRDGVYVMPYETFDKEAVNNAVAMLKHYAENGNTALLTDELCRITHASE